MFQRVYVFRRRKLKALEFADRNFLFLKKTFFENAKYFCRQKTPKQFIF